MNKYFITADLSFENGNGAKSERYDFQEKFNSKEEAEQFFLDNQPECFKELESRSAGEFIVKHEIEDNSKYDVLGYSLMKWNEDESEAEHVNSEVIDSKFYIVCED